MSKDEVIEFMKEVVMELDMFGLQVIDQDSVEKRLERMSNTGFFKDIEEVEEDLEDFLVEDLMGYE